MTQRARYATALARAEQRAEDAPLEIFLRSLDVMVDGPYAPRGCRRVRVAVIDLR